MTDVSVLHEEWKSVPGYEGRYEVSDLGRVRSLDVLAPCRGGKKSWHRGKILRFGYTKGSGRGYPYVLLHDGSSGRHRGRTFTVHRLVLTAFIGPRAVGDEARHVNGNPEDCRLANLRWGTSRENKADKIAHGTASVKLQPRDVVEIRARLSRGESLASLSRAYGVSPHNIAAIRDNTIWRGVGLAVTA